MFNEREQPTGEAYVEFSTADDRERAMTKDRQHMGGRCAAAPTQALVTVTGLCDHAEVRNELDGRVRRAREV